MCHRVITAKPIVRTSSDWRQIFRSDILDVPKFSMGHVTPVCYFLLGLYMCKIRISTFIRYDDTKGDAKFIKSQKCMAKPSMQPAWHNSVAPQRTVAKLNHVLIDAVLSSAAHYSTISNLPSLPACTLNQKKKTIAINTGLLAYCTFTKLGDNLTNISNSTQASELHICRCLMLFQVQERLVRTVRSGVVAFMDH